MNKLILALFPQGQRKLMVSLLGLVVGLGMEKLGGGLTDKMHDIIITVVAIFAGGNALEHITGIFTQQKQVYEDGPEYFEEPPQPTKELTVMDALDSVHSLEAKLNNRFAEIDKQIALQTQNIQQIVQILNQNRKAATPSQGNQG